MSNYFRNGRWLIASAFIVASCSQGDASRITGPSGALTRVSIGDGAAGASATGDVKTGTGALEIIRLRMYRLAPTTGALVVGQYALPGVTYFMNPGETIELWAEWDPDLKLVPTVIPANPRMTVSWGANEPDSPADINCGKCLLRHAYPEPGVYTVVVTLDDRNGTRVSRTFYLNSTNPAPCVPPTSDNIPSQCDAIVETAPFFMGSDLRYSAEDCSNDGSKDVAALGDVGFSINPITGAMDFSNSADVCVRVTGQNACGSSSSSFLWNDSCPD